MRMRMKMIGTIFRSGTVGDPEDQVLLKTKLLLSNVKF